MKTALVTGCAGFLGRHISRALVADNYWVYGADLAKCTGSCSQHLWMDARDIFGDQGPGELDLAIHCAAVGADRKSNDSSPLLLAGNFELDAAFFRWGAEARPGRVIYFSSSAAYPVALQTRNDRGGLGEHAINLRVPLQPDGIYGWAKLTGERLAALARDAGVAVSVVRPFSGYGETQGERFPFGALLARARRREDPFTLWGSGAQVRDFIHVADIVAAIMAIIGNSIDGPVNLGTGRGVSMTELARMICQQMVPVHSPQIVPTGENEGVAYRVASTARMDEFYTHRISLEEGIWRALP